MAEMLVREGPARPVESPPAADRSQHCEALPRPQPEGPFARIGPLAAPVDAARAGPQAGAAPAADAARAQPRDGYRYLLVLRFALLNLVGFALLGAAYAQGLVHKVLVADGTYLSLLISLVFLGGFGICARKVWQMSSELNSLRDPAAAAAAPAMVHLSPLLGRTAESRANLVGAARLRLSHRIAIVRNIANTLVLLGLIGTVLGFIIALSGVDPAHVADVSAIAPMVSTLISGMSTALYTTLVGAILNVWLMANHQLLAGATVKLIAALVERAEDHARD